MTSITARLDMMNDGLQTTEELNRMIYESAQRSRGSYQQTANLVAKLGTLAGDAFSSNREIIAFAEQLNKQMALSGTTTQEAQAAMLQLTQGLASGTLRGEELNSVLEQTPMIAQSIAKYMGVNTGEMRELASEGAITAGVVKSAMFAMADEINAKFEQMPMTWGQVWTSMQNTAIQALQPVLNAVNWLANNLSIIGPIVAGLAASFVVFQVAAHWTQIAAAAAGAYHFVVNLLTIGFGVLRGSTAAASAAVMTFNSALFASPITWIIMLVGVLIGLLYAGVAAFNKLTGSSVSATGIITGTLATLAAFVFNSVLVPIQRGFASFANFLGNVFDNPVASVKLLFYDMALTVLGFIQNVAQGLENLINKIPGVEVNLTSGIDILYNKIAQGAQTIRSESGWKEYIKAWDYKDLADAFSGGYNWGSNLFSGSSQTSALDYTNTPTYSQVSGIADSVKGIEKSVNMSEEDIKALVDVAERRYVNNINLTAQTPVITINGANTGRTAADRQNLANAIRDILIEQVSSGSARTTARAF
nr:MAG TPA: Tail tape measure [Caudoviricetes sp.]